MSGGKLIKDHAFFAGKGGKGSVFPSGVHLKSESSANDDGHVAHYEDTTEAIKNLQNEGVKKAKAHNVKDGYRH